MNYFLYQDDIPSNIKFDDVIAIDTETMGLNLQRDRLCLIQLSNGDGNAHLIQISKKATVPVLKTSLNKVIDESLEIMIWSIKRSNMHELLGDKNNDISKESY